MAVLPLYAGISGISIQLYIVQNARELHTIPIRGAIQGHPTGLALSDRNASRPMPGIMLPVFASYEKAFYGQRKNPFCSL